jgi:hypothetical protein
VIGSPDATLFITENGEFARKSTVVEGRAPRCAKRPDSCNEPSGPHRARRAPSVREGRPFLASRAVGWIIRLHGAPCAHRNRVTFQPFQSRRSLPNDPGELGGVSAFLGDAQYAAVLLRERLVSAQRWPPIRAPWPER